MKRPLLIGVIVVVVLAAGAVVPRVVMYVERQRIIAEQENVVLPPPETLPVVSSSFRSSVAVSSSIAPTPEPPPSTSIRASVNWDVPFTSQAPLGKWEEPYKEACEEASVLMVMRYFQGRPIGSPEEADKDIVQLVHVNEALGFSVDDTAAEIIELLNDQDPSLYALLLHDPTVQDIKKVLSEGSLVIVPAAGQQLGNPYFTPPGPVYHMLVIRGYTEDGYVITNDPGTKRGEGYAYKWELLMSAIHDWNGGDVENGGRVVVVVGKN
ncbi:MAG: C39 family peptidase [Candidatus Peribacteraceae bacterium]|nr:C39 family peptidase [Candidatus Peribacteraceae bacterium]MBP9850458.1 C39 family peptidase [Candidatus Peribacteraceae bacterium]